MKKKEKDFDAVKMMRNIRDKLGVKYYNDPDFMFKDLARIRKKYKLDSPAKKAA